MQKGHDQLHFHPLPQRKGPHLDIHQILHPKQLYEIFFAFLKFFFLDLIYFFK